MNTKWTEYYDGPEETTRERQDRQAFEEAEEVYRKGGYDLSELTPVKARIARNLRHIFELEIDADDLVTLDEATHLAGVDLNEFIIQAALRQAVELNRTPKSAPTSTKNELVAAKEAIDRAIVALSEAEPTSEASAAPRRRKRAS